MSEPTNLTEEQVEDVAGAGWADEIRDLADFCRGLIDGFMD